eukprot:XP_011619462.1 PREDICTED: protein NDRG3-like [Takifugu rubripes]
MMEELHDVQLTEIKPLLTGQNARNLQDFESQEHDVETAHGVLHVTMRGVAKGNRPTILTYHDVGLNRTSIPPWTSWPRCCQLSCRSSSKKLLVFTGLLNEPSLVEGLVLINIDPCAKGWMEWAASKLSGWTSNLIDTIMDHHFSTEELTENKEIVQTYRLHISQDIPQDNLGLFYSSYESRMDLEMERPVLGLNDTTVTTLRCPTLLVVGDTSPAVDAVVECNSRLNPTKTTLLKMADCGGLPQVVQPGKLAEAFKYFVQGMGYMPTAGMTRLVRSRTHSASSVGSSDGSRSRGAAVPLAEDISPSNDHAALRTIEMSA